MILRRLLQLLFCLSSTVKVQGGGSAHLIPQADVAGRVDLIEGDVHIYDSALKLRGVKVGDSIVEGDSIVTGAGSELHLQMADGSYIAVRPNTKMRITTFRAEGYSGPRFQDSGLSCALS